MEAQRGEHGRDARHVPDTADTDPLRAPRALEPGQNVREQQDSNDHDRHRPEENLAAGNWVGHQDLRGGYQAEKRPAEHFPR